jgi:hypothetical protein
MKTFKKALALCFSFIFAIATAATAQSITVNADKKLNVDLSGFKTFYWSTQVDSKLDPGLNFLNDLVLKDRIRKAVAYELEARGYKKMSSSPDMVVNFRVFDQPVTLKGYSGYGETYWGTQEIRQPEDTTSFQVERGTLLISFLDRAKGSVIWQGFASGLTSANGFDRSDNRIKQAVHLIFEEFNQRADEVQSNSR